MKTILLLFSASILWGQVQLVGPPVAKPGSIIAVAVSGLNGAAAAEWKLDAFDNGAIPSLGSAAIAANKTTLEATVSRVFMLYGLNKDVIGDGPVAVYAYTVPVAAKDPLVFKLSDVVLVDASGGVLPNSVTTTLVIPIAPIEDIDLDGKVTVADIELMVKQWKDSESDQTACKNDQNGDGKCNVRDVFSVILKYLGQ